MRAGRPTNEAVTAMVKTSNHMEEEGGTSRDGLGLAISLMCTGDSAQAQEK